jgi:hypothetical protein
MATRPVSGESGDCVVCQGRSARAMDSLSMLISGCMSSFQYAVAAAQRIGLIDSVDVQGDHIIPIVALSQ